MSKFNYIVRICKNELGVLPAERDGRLVNAESGEEIVIDNLDRKIAELEAKAVIDAKAQDIENYIYSKYPAKEQAQDNGWKENFRTKLVAGGVADIDTQIVTLAASFLKGKKLNLVLKGVDSKVKPMVEKLVKIAVKSEWRLDCINAGKTAIKNNEEADYPVFPKFK
jgi:hypothetical protein